MGTIPLALRQRLYDTLHRLHLHSILFLLSLTLLLLGL
jgi:hypothetical protein